MDDSWLLLLPPGGLVALLGLQFAHRQWPRRHDPPFVLHRIPRCLARDLADGQVARVVGRVEVDEGTPLLRAPLSGRTCIAYRVVVSHLLSYGRQRRQELLVDDFSTLPFWLRDESGRVLIEASKQRAWPVMKPMQPSSAVPPEVFREFARKHRGNHGELRDPSFEEGVLAVGTRVAVAGRIRLEAGLDREGSESGYREPAGSPVLRSLDDGRVLLSSVPIALR